MKSKDVKIGMKVIVHRKSATGWCGLKNSIVVKRAKEHNQKFLYVTAKEGKDFLLNNFPPEETNTGDYFRAKDFFPYKE